MKPFRNLAETTAPDGARLSLHEHDGEHFLKLNGRQLMSTTSTSSEILLAELACKHLRGNQHPRVLIGGLGLGFSLKRVLEMVPGGATVHVAELLGEVVQWNRDFLMKVNGSLLDDPRVHVFVEDVYELIRQARDNPYDAILLDVDNGPTSFVQPRNSRLYGRQGFGTIRRGLRPDGIVAFWSATDEPRFIEALSRAGFGAKAVEAKAHERAKRFEHRIIVASPDPNTFREPARHMRAKRNSSRV